ncbi:MAG: hypothetical protein J0H42_25720 [Rhizobiales bacterium]|nr:hypothetical protein [Hyphomicrobiales bacterium]
MKKILIVSAVTIMCSTAFAQSLTAQGDNMNKPGMTNGGRSGTASTRHEQMPSTTGQARRDPNGGNPNGTAGGPTSLSGTGSSQYGGNGTAGTSNGR